MQNVPVYRFVDWIVSRKDETSIVYRPGWMTLARRFAWTLLCAGVGVLAYIHSEAFHELWRLAGLARPDLALNALFGLLVAAGALPPLCVLWERLAIEKDVRGNLTVRHRCVLTRTRTWSLDAFHQISVLVHEVVARHKARRRYIGWRWRIRLEPNPAARHGASIEFWPDQHKERPNARRPYTRRAGEFVRFLHNLTGLPVGKPSIEEYQLTGGVFGTGRVVTHRGPAVEQQICRSREEIPARLRARLDRMAAEGRMQETTEDGMRLVVNRTITFQDADGRTHTFRSADEMPPHIRAVYEQAHRQHGVGNE